MTILIDGDSCPRAALQLIERAGSRLKITVVFFCNHPVQLTSKVIETRICNNTDQAVDRQILAQLQPTDLLITRDTQLASQALARGAAAISPHGTPFNRNDIAVRVATAQQNRNFRELGLLPQKKSRNYSAKDLHRFAAALDRLLNSSK